MHIINEVPLWGWVALYFFGGFIIAVLYSSVPKGRADGDALDIGGVLGIFLFWPPFFCIAALLTGVDHCSKILRNKLSKRG
jgi:hypothetical protein